MTVANTFAITIRSAGDRKTLPDHTTTITGFPAATSLDAHSAAHVSNRDWTANDSNIARIHDDHEFQNVTSEVLAGS